MSPSHCMKLELQSFDVQLCRRSYVSATRMASSSIGTNPSSSIRPPKSNSSCSNSTITKIDDRYSKTAASARRAQQLAGSAAVGPVCGVGFVRNRNATAGAPGCEKLGYRLHCGRRKYAKALVADENAGTELKTTGGRRRGQDRCKTALGTALFAHRSAGSSNHRSTQKA